MEMIIYTLMRCFVKFCLRIPYYLYGKGEPIRWGFGFYYQAWSGARKGKVCSFVPLMG